MTQPYGTSGMVMPTSSHSSIMILNIWRQSWSCRTSSPSLKITMIGSPAGSVFLHVIHSGFFALSM